jgi:hypothetical protein
MTGFVFFFFWDFWIFMSPNSQLTVNCPENITYRGRVSPSARQRVCLVLEFFGLNSAVLFSAPNDYLSGMRAAAVLSPIEDVCRG